MSGQPILIDAFCCAGGATKGYQRAGFYVIGVDIDPQPNYCGDVFIQMDALEFMATLAYQGYIDIPGYGRLRLEDIAAWHGSPPCQFHSAMSNCRDGLAASYLDLIPETRDFFEWFGLPYVIENVVGAPLREDLLLCGMQFGRELYRHRLFEANFPLEAPTPGRPQRDPKACGFDHPLPASRAGHWEPGTIMSVAGHVAPVALAREIMDIDWTTRDELTEAIPTYYAEHVGLALMEHLGDWRYMAPGPERELAKRRYFPDRFHPTIDGEATA